jgi:hypothetical protein
LLFQAGAEFGRGANRTNWSDLPTKTQGKNRLSTDTPNQEGRGRSRQVSAFFFQVDGRAAVRPSKNFKIILFFEIGYP